MYKAEGSLQFPLMRNMYVLQVMYALQLRAMESEPFSPFTDEEIEAQESEKTYPKGDLIK